MRTEIEYFGYRGVVSARILSFFGCMDAFFYNGIFQPCFLLYVVIVVFPYYIKQAERKKGLSGCKVAQYGGVQKTGLCHFDAG